MSRRDVSSDDEDYEEPGPSSRVRNGRRDQAPYAYRKLEDFHKRCTENSSVACGILKGPLSNRNDENRNCFAYLAVTEVLSPEYPNSYKLRVSDDTMENVLLRIHDLRGSEAGKVIGPKPFPEQIIRIHRATAQMESKNRDHYEMVLSLAGHQNYTLIKVKDNGDILFQTVAKKVSQSRSDVKRIKTIWDFILNIRNREIESLLNAETDDDDSESQQSGISITSSDADESLLSDETTSEGPALTNEQIDRFPVHQQESEALDSHSIQGDSYIISQPEVSEAEESPSDSDDKNEQIVGDNNCDVTILIENPEVPQESSEYDDDADSLDRTSTLSGSETDVVEANCEEVNTRSNEHEEECQRDCEIVNEVSNESQISIQSESDSDGENEENVSAANKDSGSTPKSKLRAGDDQKVISIDSSSESDNEDEMEEEEKPIKITINLKSLENNETEEEDIDDQTVRITGEENRKHLPNINNEELEIPIPTYENKNESQSDPLAIYLSQSSFYSSRDSQSQSEEPNTSEFYTCEMDSLSQENDQLRNENQYQVDVSFLELNSSNVSIVFPNIDDLSNENTNIRFDIEMDDN